MQLGRCRERRWRADGLCAADARRRGRGGPEHLQLDTCKSRGKQVHPAAQQAFGAALSVSASKSAAGEWERGARSPLSCRALSAGGSSPGAAPFGASGSVHRSLSPGLRSRSVIGTAAAAAAAAGASPASGVASVTAAARGSADPPSAAGADTRADTSRLKCLGPTSRGISSTYSARDRNFFHSVFFLFRRSVLFSQAQQRSRARGRCCVLRAPCASRCRGRRGASPPQPLTSTPVVPRIGIRLRQRPQTRAAKARPQRRRGRLRAPHTRAWYGEPT